MAIFTWSNLKKNFFSFWKKNFFFLFDSEAEMNIFALESNCL